MMANCRVLALLAVLALSACDRPAQRVRHVAPVPHPAVPPGTPIAASATSAASPSLLRQFPDEPPSPVQWNPATAAFEFKGQALRAEKVWTFDGATDGFVATHGEVLPADGSGLSVTIGGRDSILRTPRGLNVAGANRSLVLVRLTRTGAVKRLDPTVYYSTATHGESQAWFAKPAFGGHPRLNDTVTMVFDMHRLAAGGDDWKTSKIDQVRLDFDDGPGGAFIIRQVAIAEDPGNLFPAQPAAPKAVEAAKPKPAGTSAAKKPASAPAKSKPKGAVAP
jgi:hypothetical protein